MALTPRRVRELTVLLHADIAGSTALVQRDETLAHARITDTFARLSSAVQAYGGQVHEIRGDALVADFARASDAVCAALRFQIEQESLPVRDAEDIVPHARIGIALGEVVLADATVTGPGIVLAQRVEQLAAPGGLCVTGAVYEAVPRRLPCDYRDLGRQTLKGIDGSTEVYAVELHPGATLPAPDPGVMADVQSTRRSQWVAAAIVALATLGGLAWWLSLAPPESAPLSAPLGESEASTLASMQPETGKPSIVVLPFDNMSGDASQDYFSDGLSEDLITDLAKISGMLVIARQTSFSYKGQARDLRRIGAELGVRYLLEGSVRRAGERVRINAQLIDAKTGMHIWAERYDRDLTDIFELQDEVTARIVDSLSVTLSQSEREGLERRRSVDAEAYDLVAQGKTVLFRFTKANNLDARALFSKALALDPNYAYAHAYFAHTYAVEAQFGWAEPEHLDQSARTAMRIAARALELDASLPQAYFSRGLAQPMAGSLDAGIDTASQCIAKVPNYADCHGLLGFLLTYRGELTKAWTALERGMRLNPHFSYNYLYARGRVRYLQGRIPEAIAELESTLERNPEFNPARIWLIAAYVRAGDRDEAEWQYEELLASAPAITLARVRKINPFAVPELRDMLLGDLRAVGFVER